MRKLGQGHIVAKMIFRQMIMASLMLLMGALPTIVGQRSGLFFSKQPGGMPVIQDTHVNTGNVFFVMTGGTDGVGYGLSPDAPFATIDYAIGRCTANQGDEIKVMPGHTETISAAAGITCDVAGIKITGLGWGTNRPLVTFSATGSTWTISAASVYIKNILVTSSVNELVKMFDTSAPDFTLDAVDYLDPGAALETIQFLLTTNACDRGRVINCNHRQANAAASAQKWISLVGPQDFEIENCRFFLDLNDDATSSVIAADANVRQLYVNQVNGLMTGYSSNLLSFILGASGATGTINDCKLAADVAAITTINDYPSGYSFEVYANRVVDKNGKLDPVI